MDIIKSMLSSLYIVAGIAVTYLFIKKVLSLNKFLLSMICIILVAIMLTISLNAYYDTLSYETDDEPVATVYIMHYDDKGNYLYHHNGIYYYEEFRATSSMPLDRKVDDNITTVYDDDDENPRIETYRQYKNVFGFKESSYVYVIHVPQGSIIED